MPISLWLNQPMHKENGNILFMILIAIALIGALTAVIQHSSNPDGANIDEEELILRASEIQRYASELERSVMFIMQNGHSEVDIRFAHPKANSDYGDLSADGDPSDQVFHKNGGGAAYRTPPSGVNDGSAWEFYGGTAIPGVGSNKADLVAVLPNVTGAFCQRINDLNNQSGTPTDTGSGTASGSNPGDCVNIGALGRYDSGQQFYSSPNTMDETTFEQDSVTSAAHTALQACVACSADSENHFYHVLLAR
jgi:hypothetical protein